jgi:hypothetical protein
MKHRRHKARHTTKGRSAEARAQRTIHLVDVENLVGSSAACRTDVAEICRMYGRVANVAPADLVVVASGACAAEATWYGWPSARRLLRRGVDGADRALLDVIANERLAIRFTRVVVASGDGIFAKPCALLQAQGCGVTVVTRPEALSGQLRLAVRDVRYLDAIPSAPVTLMPLASVA